jgi:hypothetical protein
MTGFLTNWSRIANVCAGAKHSNGVPKILPHRNTRNRVIETIKINIRIIDFKFGWFLKNKSTGVST